MGLSDLSASEQEALDRVWRGTDVETDVSRLVRLGLLAERGGGLMLTEAGEELVMRYKRPSS